MTDRALHRGQEHPDRQQQQLHGGEDSVPPQLNLASQQADERLVDHNDQPGQANTGDEKERPAKAPTEGPEVCLNERCHQNIDRGG
jgi:hypothetical protein